MFGKRERRKLATRSELVLAGRRLFSEKGLYESRIEDLTTEAGIAKGTLYTYFADKDELIREVAAAGFAELEARVARGVKRARSGADVVRQAIRAHLQFFDDNPDLMRVLHQVRGMLKFDRPEWLPLRETLNRYLEALARLLSAAPAVARLPVHDRLELAQVIFGAVSGVTSVNVASGPRSARAWDRVAMVDALAAMAGVHIAGRGRAGSRTLVRRRRPPGAPA